MRTLATLVCVLILSLGCSQTKILVADYSAPAEETKGILRVAQDKITVMIEGTSEVAEIEGASRYFLVSKGDLKLFIQGMKKLQELEKVK